MNGNENWRLWNLQALIPDATEATLKNIEAKRDALALDGNHFVSSEGIIRIMREAKQFVSKHPWLATGITVTMHIGPYAFVPGLHMLLGAKPVVLSNRQAKNEIESGIKTLRSLPGLDGDMQWITTDEKNFTMKIARQLKRNNPVIVYLDGNSGAGGITETRETGVSLELPGRTIRVRDGIARLAVRMELPIHGVVARWREDNSIEWSIGFSQKWGKDTDPETVARTIYGWGFNEAIKTPEQWTLPAIINHSSECFRSEKLIEDIGLEQKYQLFQQLLKNSKTKVLLKPGVKLWGSGILADLSRQKFYSAEGLSDAALNLLKVPGGVSVSSLYDLFGSKWISFHGARLYMLGLLECT